MSLKPWREIAVPHEDVLKGTFQQAEFAADISRVHDRTAAAEYQDPVLFFKRTFITEGMRLLLDSVVRRLSGQGGDPVIQLQTAFGGGKTHTMLAALHLAQGQAAIGEMEGVASILSIARVASLPKARIAVLDGIKLSPNQPRVAEGQELRTLWGELAWQLGGPSGYAMVAESDRSGTSPGKDVLAQLIAAHAPCVILVDELVAYVRQFDSSKSLAGGTYDSNLSFIQALTEALKAVPTALMLASLPESEGEAGSERGIATLKTLEKCFGRVQAIWKPVGTDEAFEIVRRRLFSEIRDPQAAQAVCQAFADHYVQHSGDLPSETIEGHYLARLNAAYPIHPELFERLYKDWSSIPNFQRTRGVLKLMAKVIHCLWQDQNSDPLLMPASLPLYDATVRTELTSYLPPGWDPVLERDVDGDRSEPVDMEMREPKFGAFSACRRTTRAIFLGSAPTSVNETAQGLETERILLGCLMPGQAPYVYRDALSRLEGRLSYLSRANSRWYFDVRPNLRRAMEERKRRFKDEEDVYPLLRQIVQRSLGSGPFDSFHVFTPHADVPDDWSLRLVVLSPQDAHSRTTPGTATQAAMSVLRHRGDQPRVKMNRVLFLAADAEQVSHLKDTLRILLAWKSIISDVREDRITLDNRQLKQAEQSRDQIENAAFRGARETFRWLLAPAQQGTPAGGLTELAIEAFPLNPAAQHLSPEIERVARENEVVINDWSPIHLHQQLKAWFWKDAAVDVAAVEVWAKFCSYSYFPRLRKVTVLDSAIAAGAPSRDFFGLAYGKDVAGNYTGFMLGRSTTPVMETLLLIEPTHAAGVEQAIQATAAASASSASDSASPGGKAPAPAVTSPAASGLSAASATRYFGTVTLDPTRAALDFSIVVKELIELFTADPDSRVSIKVDIEAANPKGFAESTVRAAKENAKLLKFKDSGFE